MRSLSDLLEIFFHAHNNRGKIIHSLLIQIFVERPSERHGSEILDSDWLNGRHNVTSFVKIEVP